MLENGFILDGKFEILRQIGKGGSSLVYLAMNSKMNQQWVIKEIPRHSNNADTERVLQEARMMMQFDHPAIPRITDILEQPDSTYIIMDYVSGQSLAHKLKEVGNIPQDVALEWGRQICNVLCYLHSQQPPIIYHDLKPGNVILKEPEHNIKLIDFGEARQCINGNAPGGGRTKEYAAPEQQPDTRGKTDARTDIYCFGTTMYRLLTGHFPPKLPTRVDSIRERYPDLNISKGVDNIIRKCTNPDPNKRFQTAGELMKALESVDLWDDDYIKQQKRKIKLFMASIGLSAAMCVTGIGLYAAQRYTNSQNYEEKIRATGDGKIESYLEAIEINGKDTRAYILLLDAYEESGRFGDDESRQLSAVYNAYLAGADNSTIDMQELNFKIGRMYFQRYTGEQDSFRIKILRAKDYFERVVEGAGEDKFENYMMAESYYTFCNFFISYVLDDTGGFEPDIEDYRGLLNSVEVCLGDMQTYEARDAVRTRLTMYGRILDTVNSNIRGFAAAGIEQDTLEKTVGQVIREAINAEAATNENSDIQMELDSYCDDVLDNIEREYGNVRR